jgi:hypothetical protein
MKNQFTHSGNKVIVGFNNDSITIEIEGNESIVISKHNIAERVSEQLSELDPTFLSKLLWFLKKKLPSIKAQDVRDIRTMIETIENILKMKNN